MKLTDRINSMPPREAVRGAFVMVDHVQAELPEVQVMGAALLFLTMCEEAGLHVPTVLNQAERMRKDGDINREVCALVDYVRSEVRG